MPHEARDEALIKLEEIVDNFLSRPDSGPFREPVDWKELELFDYPVIVQHPMDLGSVKRRLESSNYYPNAATAARDIRLIFENCKTYNSEGSEFHLLAKSYARRFEDLYRKIRHEFDVGKEVPLKSNTAGNASNNEGEVEEDFFDSEEDETEDDDDDGDEGEGNHQDLSAAESEVSVKKNAQLEPPKLDDKSKFAANLLLLNGTHLGKVIHLLEQHCPQALEQSSIPEQLEIVIDNIDEATFPKVAEYSEKHAVRRKGASQIEEAVLFTRHPPPPATHDYRYESSPSSVTKDKRSRGRPRSDARDILQIDVKTGTVVAAFSSLSAAGHAVGFSRHIVAAILRGKYKTNSYAGWTFRYDSVDKDDYDDDEDIYDDMGGDGPKKKRKLNNSNTASTVRAIAVEELDAKSGKVIEVHNSLTRASKTSGANRHIIQKCLQGELDQWQGRSWRYGS